MKSWTEHGQSLYLELLHANFLSAPFNRQRAFAARFAEAVTLVDDHDLGYWINDGWRERLTAAWIIAARRDTAYRYRVTQRLLASEMCFAGQGLCIATASYRDQAASDALNSYLQIYLPAGSRQYDQEWAVDCLVWLDGCLGTNRAQSFLNDPELWKLTDHGRELGAMSPHKKVETIARAMAFLDNLFAK